MRDVAAEHARLAAAGVPVSRPPRLEPWGLVEMWIEDPDGVRIVLVEVPDGPSAPPRPALSLAPGRRSTLRSGRLGPPERPPSAPSRSVEEIHAHRSSP